MQTNSDSTQPIAFVTGATGLLGNNLVRELVADGYHVKALVRSPEKAKKQFSDLAIEIIKGDMLDIANIGTALQGVDVLFHTAAYFRDSYKGGSHWQELYQTNVEGTRALLERAKQAGVMRFVHTSSIAVLRGEPGQLVNETMLRDEKDADDYYRSKILSDHIVLSFLEENPDFWAAMVVPGWMHGPGDLGPTAAGQAVIDVVRGNMPGIIPGSFAVVDARDVARAMILVHKHGRRGERYLAAGCHMTMADLLPMIARIAGVKAPTRRIPLTFLRGLAAWNELYARLTRNPVLLGWATVKNIASENNRSHFDPSKGKKELGLQFRPVEKTLSDEINWFRENGYLPKQ